MSDKSDVDEGDFNDEKKGYGVLLTVAVVELFLLMDYINQVKIDDEYTAFIWHG